MRDGQATRQRLLDAAAQEFSLHGLAGARVERIASAAHANKAQIYAFFGNKQDLFDLVLRDRAQMVTAAVPLDPTDLPGYAVAVYDACLASPELVRLAAWDRLERRPTGRLEGVDGATDTNLAAIAGAQERGDIVGDIRPAHVLALLFSMALSWSPISLVDTAAPTDARPEHQARREALTRAVRAAFLPSGHGEESGSS